MALGYDANSYVGNLNTTNPLSHTHTTGALATLAFHAVSFNSAQSFTSCTHDGAAVTAIGTDIQNTTEFWAGYKLLPSVGAKTVTVTMNSTTDRVQGTDTHIGVKNAAPTTTAKSKSGSASPQVVIVTTPGQLVVVAAGQHGVAGVAWAPIAGTTETLEYANAAATHRGELVMGYAIATGTSTTVGWTTSASVDWVIVAAAFDPQPVGQSIMWWF